MVVRRIVMTTPHPPTIHITNDFKTIKHLEFSLNIDDLRAAVKAGLDELEALANKITNGHFTTWEVQISDVQENWSSTEPNYSLLDFLNTSTVPFLSALQSRFPQLFLRKDSGEWYLELSAASQIMAEIEAFLKLACILGFITVGQLPRVREWLRHLFRNGFCDRTMFLSGGSLWFVIRQIKTETMTRHGSFIAHKSNARYQDIILKYLAFIRPFEAIMASGLWGSNAGQLYYRSMWVMNGAVASDTWFYNAFRTFMNDRCKAPGVGSRSFRQIVCAMARLYMGSESFDMVNPGEEEDFVTLARGMSVIISRKV
jgi:hypothetical protein